MEGQGPARVAEIRGDKGDWYVVQSRKRKATEPEFRGHDRSRELARQGGAARGFDQDMNIDLNSVFNYSRHS